MIWGALTYIQEYMLAYSVALPPYCPGQCKYLTSPGARPPSLARRAKRTARTMHTLPTTMYASPRKGFLPPMTLDVDTTSALVPLKPATGKLAETLKRSIEPAGTSVVMRPYSLRKSGSAAGRIHTMKCSSEMFCTRVGGRMDRWWGMLNIKGARAVAATAAAAAPPPPPIEP